MTDAAGAAPREATLGEALREWTKAILVAIAAWLLLRTFLLEAFRIPSSSMENTLRPGDHLFVNKAIYGPEIPGLGLRLPAWREPARGDVLVFDSVEERDMKVVKRAVGLPGDTLEMRRSVLYRNGAPVEEAFVRHDDPTRSEMVEARHRMYAWQVRYLARDTTGYSPDLQDWGPLVVPAGSLFMMGDNRDNSYDSRYWGFLPRRAVRGTPLFIYFSYDPASEQPLRLLTTIRWRRFFTQPR